jgi:hypothetical protein
MSREHGPSLHVEWSPGRVRAIDIASGRRHSGTSLAEMAPILAGHKTAIVGISRQLVFLKTAPLPKAAPEDLRRILGIQMAQLFPLPSDQLSFDFIQTAHRAEDGLLTLIAAVRADDLRLLNSDLAAAGIRAERVLPVGLGAIVVAARAGMAQALVVEESPDGAFTLDVVAEGVVRLSRTASDSQLERETQRTTAAAGIGDIGIVIAGAPELHLPGASAAPRTSLELLHEAPPFFFELGETRALEAKKRVALHTRVAILMMLSALLLVALVWADRSDAQAIVTRGQGSWARRLGKERSILNAYVTKAQQGTAMTTTLNGAFAVAQPVGDIAAVAGDSLPPSAWMTGISIERGKPVQVRGTASNPDDIARLLKTLTASARFRDVRLVVANSGRINTTPVVEFNVTAVAIGNLPMPVADTRKAVVRRAAPAATAGEPKQ